MSINPRELQSVGIQGQRLVAIEPAPLGGIAAHRYQATLVSTNLYFGDAVDSDFKRALPVAAASGDLGLNALELPAPIRVSILPVARVAVSVPITGTVSPVASAVGTTAPRKIAGVSFAAITVVVNADNRSPTCSNSDRPKGSVFHGRQRR